MRLLREFHKLSELELLIDGKQDLNVISKCFSQFHNLRKLMIDVRGWHVKLHQNRPNPINDLGKIIGANLNLTHLELFQNDGAGGNLSKIFGYIPYNSPLKLKHLALSDNFSNVQAIASHARSLRSIDLSAYRSAGTLTILRSECIFPPSIKVLRVDEHLIGYLRQHPQIVGLSIHTNYQEIFGRMMLELMAQHSESLKRFSTSFSGFFDCIKRVENEFLLLRCTKLEQLTLRHDYYLRSPDLNVPQDLVS